MKRTLIMAFLFTLLLLSAVSTGTVMAQEDATDEAPAPDFYVPRPVQMAYEAGTRSFDGNPGPNYWQNKSVHNIEITVSPPSRTISATETISYTNNSPNELAFITLRTYMNVHQANAQREETYPLDFITPGIQVDAFSVNGNAIDPDLVFTSGKTEYVIPLGEPGMGIQPGDTWTFDFSWHYDLAPANGWKEGVVDDTTFFLAYFYPRLAILNDTPNLFGGWDYEEFTALSGRELANDFADFTFSVNVPQNFVVWATGELQNPDEVLQPEVAERLADSMTSDEITTIATAEETQDGMVTAQTDTVTWRWQADHVAEIALGLSDHYQWDAGSVEVDPGTGRRASVQAAYDPAATAWENAVQDGKDALVFGSTEWPGVPYPYPKTTLFLGGAGEEYPMMANDGAEGAPIEGASGTRFEAAHELFHSWFPWYMGTDERRYPFMDEGWTTAFEYLFNVQDLGPELADEIFIQFRSGQLMQLDAGMDIPIIFAADRTRGLVTGRNAYDKPALGYLALKELMGDEAFKAALHEFIDRWHGKHPLPWDMFNTFNGVSNDVSGEDLTWFFNAWFFEPHYLDLALESVEPSADGYAVEVHNIGGMPMPFDVVVTYADDSSESFRQNPAVWAESEDTITVQIDTEGEPVSITLNGGIFLDFDETDNAWDAAVYEQYDIDVLMYGAFYTTGGAAGVPAINIPIGSKIDLETGAPTGEPAGVAITGPYLSDAQLFAVGYALEQALGGYVAPNLDATIDGIEAVLGQ